MPKTKFKFLENIATADLAFEAFGKSYNELFENAAYALESAMVNLDSLEASQTSDTHLSAANLESLLFNFLNELIFLKDSEQLLFKEFKCRIKETKEGKLWELDVKLKGQKIDLNKQKLGMDVKAVTKHLFKVEELHSKTFRCLVILDV